jgi:hypothetical protein
MGLIDVSFGGGAATVTVARLEHPLLELRRFGFGKEFLSSQFAGALKGS